MPVHKNVLKACRACRARYILKTTWFRQKGMSAVIRIAVDAMGGDHAPQAVVEGSCQALGAMPGITIKLVGDENRIKESLGNQVPGGLQIVHAPEVISNDESPAMAVRRKKQSSLVVATSLLRQGEADAMVTAGSTGAFMSAGLLVLGRMRGIHRPGLAPILPTVDGQGVVLLDIGANMDAKPEHLMQYAVMGSIYAEQVLGIERPRVGLLNVGAEQGKGNQLAKDTYPLIESLDLNFVGNVEARELLSGVADVVVTDGFVGNVVLKFMEGMAAGLMQMLKAEFTRNVRSKLGAGLLRPGLRRFKQKMDYSEYGGAPLLGVKQAMVKCHGSSNARAIENGILQAARFVEQDFTGRIAQALSLSGVAEGDKEE